MRSTRNLKRNAIRLLTILIMTLALTGSACPIKHNFPDLKVPEKPKGLFTKEGDRWYITRPNFIKLNAYNDALLDQNKKYRREIEIINGD